MFSEVKAGEHIVPIELEGQLLITSGNQSNESKQRKTSTQESTTSQGSSEEKKVTSSLTGRDTSTINVPISSSIANQSLIQTRSSFDDLIRDALVPIDNRGLFFQDSFFENSRRHFQDAINQVMRRVSTNTPVSDPINWYQNHRTSNLLEDTRAGTITTEDSNYKVALVLI